MTNTTPSLLAKARQLIQMGLIVAAPMSPALADDEADPTPPASTAQLQADFSAAGTYANSGWFTGELDESKAAGSTLGMGFKLSGHNELTDSQLYNRSYHGCWDGICDPSQLYYYRGDTTGIAFVWGGKVTGELVPGDELRAAYEFTIDWSHTNPQVGAYDDASVSWALTMGFANVAGAEGPIGAREVLGNKRATNQTSGSLYDTGATTFQGEFGAQYYSWDENPQWYWFVVLEAHLSESGPRSTYPGDPAPYSMNGDYLRLTVPQHSIDIGMNAVPVPEPGAWPLAAAGLAVAGLLARRQRQRRPYR